jgi:hypothetical protein
MPQYINRQIIKFTVLVQGQHPSFTRITEVT